MSNEVVIVGYVRTPIGKFGGSLKNLKTAQLCAECIKALLERVNIDSNLIDEVIIGSALQGGMAQNIARQAAFLAGLPLNVNAYTVNKVCSSGMQAIFEAYKDLVLKRAEIVIAGGAESMSTAPIALPSDVRWGFRHLILRDLKFIDLMVHDGLYDAIDNMIMGQEADKVARMHNLSREELDWYSYQSHMRAWKATEEKLFIDLEPVDTHVSGEKVFLDRDEGIRPDTSIEKLSKLKPVFNPDGLLTAGNSSQLSDGAAVLLLTTIDKAKELGLKPIAKIVDYDWHLTDSWRFTEAPMHVIDKLLRKLKWSVNDVDVFEVNEAFASVPVMVNKYLKVPYSKMNLFGGAIALGHPLGASGARIVTTLLAVLKHVGGKRGIAALCHGGGGATAIALEIT
ncbi:MAG: acetyl-CoA acetyltransferase [Thermoprotei archaeon ex4572_64]|nr:MAG: acetyl-CoA acetyltransferase [Thermoprotei archaeon ex4572_64]